MDILSSKSISQLQLNFEIVRAATSWSHLQNRHAFSKSCRRNRSCGTYNLQPASAFDTLLIRPGIIHPLDPSQHTINFLCHSLHTTSSHTHRAFSETPQICRRRFIKMGNANLIPQPKRGPSNILLCIGDNKS